MTAPSQSEKSAPSVNAAPVKDKQPAAAPVAEKPVKKEKSPPAEKPPKKEKAVPVEKPAEKPAKEKSPPAEKPSKKENEAPPAEKPPKKEKAKKNPEVTIFINRSSNLNTIKTKIFFLQIAN